MSSSDKAQNIEVFAYGSNMLRSRIRERCPTAAAQCSAELRSHRLCWHKKNVDGSGKCDVVTADPGGPVFGVLYSVAVNEKPALDRAEGLGNGYAEKSVDVLCQGRKHAAHVYYATDIDPSLKPYTWYRALVLAGAEEHALPSHYVEALRRAEVTDDLDRTRHDKNMALLGEARNEAAL